MAHFAPGPDLVRFAVLRPGIASVMEGTRKTRPGTHRGGHTWPQYSKTGQIRARTKMEPGEATGLVFFALRQIPGFGDFGVGVPEK